MLRNKKLRFLWETCNWNGKYRNPEDYSRNMQPRQQRYWTHMPIWLLLEQMFQSSPRVDWLQPTVTPFSKDILPMDDVEIGDVTIAYDDPRSGQTYILVICNALLIPSMEHNLIPPFLIREAELFLDETPKFMQWTQQWQIIGSLIVRLACIYIWTWMAYSPTLPQASWHSMRLKIGINGLWLIGVLSVAPCSHYISVTDKFILT